MKETLTPLILDLLEWIAREPRSYEAVMDAWRTSCPRLAVWEETVDRGFVSRTHRDGGIPSVELTAQGWDFLTSNRQMPSPNNATGFDGADARS